MIGTSPTLLRPVWGWTEKVCDMIDLMAVYARLTSHGYQSWYAIPLRLIVGYGFMS
jgi:hypothetical protein